jgi:hypothetical protein
VQPICAILPRSASAPALTIAAVMLWDGRESLGIAVHPSSVHVADVRLTHRPHVRLGAFQSNGLRDSKGALAILARA